MKVDCLAVANMTKVAERARALDASGYDGALVGELNNDPFLPLALVAEHTERIELMTSIAVAFARNPMLVAQTAHDLNVYSKGRFVLGLGSQVKAHIERRFSMPWSRPAARMREFVLAMRAIWDCWHQGKQLDFRGEFYAHTLMPPTFMPTVKRYGAPRVFLAAVGPRMTEVAGEIADGLVCHTFTSERYLREVTLPAVERGLAVSGRSRSDFEISCPLFLATGPDEGAIETARADVRQQLAFYASTPTYRGVLECHGWGELQPELTRLSKQGRWGEMPGLIDESMLETFAVVAEPDEAMKELRRRGQGVIDRLICMNPLGSGDEERKRLELLHG